ncbi:MAG: mechanosensitive ion channel family protein [Syntrophomonadaceae bacterium]
MEQLINMIHVWVEYWLSYDHLYSILAALLIVVLFTLVRKYVVQYIFKWIRRWTSDSDNFYPRIIDALEAPLRLFIMVVGIFLALRVLPLSIMVDAAMLKLFRSAIILILGWAIYKFSSPESIISKEVRERLDVDEILIPILSKVLRFIIIALVIVIVANEWGYDVNGFIAGLGLGGLALALAAQNALANLFGGLIIILEKPFSIGDWIATPSVEGTVETITFRSTLIRGFDQAVITVPNATLANEPITNHTRMGKRRIFYYLGLSYATTGQEMETCVKRIRQMLNDHPDIHKETIMVNFESFGDSRLNIIIYCFTNTTVWSEYLEVREDVNLKIMEIVTDMGLSLALPSRVLYHENKELG